MASVQEQSTTESARVELQIETLRAAISTLPEGHLDLRGLYLELVKLLHNRFLDTNELEHLEEVINLQRQIVARSRLYYTENDLFWACHDLAISLVMQIEETGDDDVLSHAIDLHREALGLTRPGHSGRPLSCVHLSTALLLQYENTGEEITLQESLALAEDAISLCPPGHSDRALACGHLARVLTVVYERSADDVEVLGRIIELEREGLSLRAETEKSRLMGNLSASLYLYYQATGDPAHLDEAITLQRTAISLRASDEEDHVLSCLQLSPLLNAQFELTGNVSCIEEAVQSAREALVLCPRGHRNRYSVCENLARCIYLACLQTGEGEKLGEAIALRRECLNLRPPGHLDRLMMGIDLATTLCFRFECTGDGALVNEAIIVVEDVIKQCPDGDIKHRANALAQLASLVNWRFERTGQDYFLNQAILKIHEAISLRPSDHPDYAKWSAQLALYLTTLYDRTGELDVLEYVIATERNVLALYPPGNIHRPERSANLAASLLTLYDVKKDSRLITEATELCTEAVSDSHTSTAWRPWTLLCHAYLKDDTEQFDVNVAIASLTNALNPGAQGLTSLILATIGILDSIWSHVGAATIPQSLVPAYKKLIHLLPTQANFTLDKLAQVDAVEACTMIGSDAFVAAVSSGFAHDGLELLESAQGIFWSQALRQREPDLTDLPEPIAEELKQLLSSVVASGPIEFVTIPIANNQTREIPLSQDARHQANARIHTLLRQVREMPGLESFMLSASYQALSKAACHHPVVVLVAARARCYGMIMRGSCEPHLMLLDFDPEIFDLQSIVVGQRGTGDIGTIERGMGVSGGGKISTVQRNLAILWRKVVVPILDHLGLQRAEGCARPRLHWCPTGRLSFVPLHAAGIYHGPVTTRVNCSNYVVSSYAPTITSLIRAQDREARLHIDEIRLLLVAEKRPAETTLATIYGVDEELRQIQNVTDRKYPVKILGGADFPGEATVDRVSQGIQEVNIVHLACHGIQSKDNPLESGFCLSDGRLTVSKMMEMDLKDGFLAFCSACETGKGDRDQPDQVVHIAAAMLFSGFRNVIATMWAVNDADGPKVARWVYEELYQQEMIDSDSVAYALDVAVDKLRRSGLPPERWAPFVHIGA